MRYLYVHLRAVRGNILPLFSCVSILLVMAGRLSAQPPVITSLSRYSGIPGDSVVIRGSGFNATAANNFVYMGATRANIYSASGDSVIGALIPPGATYWPVSVLNYSDSQLALSPLPLLPNFIDSYFIANTLNFKNRVNYRVRRQPEIAGICDLDGDGLPDLVVAESSGGSGTSTVIFKNVSTPGAITGSSFTPVDTLLTSGGPTNIQFADLDRDGKQDVLITCRGASTVCIYRNLSSAGTINIGSRATISTISSGLNGAQPFEVAVADFDGDGKPDMVTSSPFNSATRSTISVMRNVSRRGTLNSSSFDTAVGFNTPSSLGTDSDPIGLCAADFDGDGKPDIAVACTTGNAIAVYRNTATTGNITSSSFATPNTFSTGSLSKPIDVIAVDVDGDGKLDMVSSNSGTNRISVFRNTSSSGSISFATKVDFTTGSAPTGLAAGDMNGDGKPDIVVTNAASNTVSIFRNTASSGSITTSSFAAKVDYATGLLPFGVNVGDLDLDGYPDVITANNGDSSISIIRNYPLPTVNAITGVSTVCAGGDTTLFSATPAGGYWSSSNSSIATVADGVVYGVANGTATITYTIVAGGDTNYSTRSVTVNALPSVNAITGGSTVCPGNSISLSNSTFGGIWGVTNTSLATISSGGVFTGIAPGTDSATYTVTSFINGCRNTAYKAITISILPYAGLITGADSLCTGTTTTYTDSVAGGTWSTANTSIATVNSAGAVYGVSAGSTTLTYSYTNSCGTAYVTKNIAVRSAPATPSAITGPTAVCVGSSITLASATPCGSWTSANTSLASVDGSGNVSGTGTGSVSISYTVSNACGSSSVSRTITVLTQPTAAITSALQPCNGRTTHITISGTPGARITYIIDGTTTIDTLLSSGSFTLTTVAITSPHSYTLYNVYNASCSLLIDTTVNITPAAMQWAGGATGATTDWMTAANWVCGNVPTDSDDVVIPAGTMYHPVVSSGVAHAGSIIIDSTAIVSITGGSSLAVSGNLQINGTVAGAGKVTINGGTTQHFTGTGTINNLSLNTTTGLVIDSGSLLNIDSTLQILSGTLTTNDSLVLKAVSVATAMVLPIISGGISGKVRVQQYIPGGLRRYRFIGHPHNEDIALAQLQDDIDITGQGGSANGFTNTASNAPSAFWYNPLFGDNTAGNDPGWRPFTNTYGTPDSNLFHRYQGIRIFMRGAKGEGLGYGTYTPSPVVIETYGQVNQGQQIVRMVKGSAAGQDVNLLGNPYPSPVDLGAVAYRALTTGNVTGSAFYVWNPYLGTGGQFQTIPITGAPYYLQAYGAFEIVTASNSDSLVFNESDKAGNVTTHLLKADPAYQVLSVYSNTGKEDELYIGWNNAATPQKDERTDAIKLKGGMVNLYSLSSEGSPLAIDSRPVTALPIALGISSVFEGTYSLQLENLSSGGTIYLHDKLTDNYHELHPGEPYTFTITKDAATQGNKRFELIDRVPELTQISASVWPNPATNRVTVHVNKSVGFTVNIYNTLGVLVHTSQAAAGSGSIDISMQGYPAGIYEVVVACAGEHVTKQLLKE